MLIGLDPRLTPDLLFHLARLGHGDEFVVVDRNFPAYSKPGVPVIDLPGLSSPELAAMVLRLVPLDSFVEDAAFRMEVVGDPAAVEPVQREVEALLAHHAGNRRLASLERFAFYDRAGACQLILRSGEPRFFGCFLFKVGVISPEDSSRNMTA